MLSILLAICVFMMPMTAFAEAGDDVGKVRITCQGVGTVGGNVYYKLNGEGEFQQVNIIDGKYDPIPMTDSTTSITIKFVPNAGFQFDTKLDTILRVNGAEKFKGNGEAVGGFTAQNGYTINFTSELLGGSTVAESTFELEFGFAPENKREFSIRGNGDFAVGGAIKYKFDGDEGFKTAEVKTNEEDQSKKYFDRIDLGKKTSITIKIEPQPEYRLEDVCLREDGSGNAAAADEIAALLSENGKTYTLSSDKTNFDFEFTLRNKQEGGNRPFRNQYSGTYVENIPVTVNGELNFCINDSIFYGSDEIPGDLTVDYHYTGETVDFYVECHINKKYTQLKINGTDYLSQIPTTDAGLLGAIQGQLYRFKISVTKANSYEIESATAEVSGDEMVVGNFLWWYERNENVNDDDLIEHGKMELQSIKVNGETFQQTEFLCWEENKDGSGGSAVLPAGTEITVKIIPDAGYQLTEFALNGNPFKTGAEPSVFVFNVARGNFHLGAKITKVGDEVKSGTDTVKSGEVDLGSNTIDSGSVILSVSDSATGKDKFSKEGYTINSVLDINLNQVWYKGTLEDYWEKALNNLANEVDITLDLAENFEEVVILHKHGDGVEEITPTLNNGKLSFKTNSFSDFALAVKEINPENGGCFQVVYDDRESGKVEAQIGSENKFTASPNVWGKWYKYSDNSQAINFTVTVPEDRKGQTPIVEVVNQSDENFESKTISASGSNGTYTFSITPNALFDGVDIPSINVFVNWSEFDKLSAGEGEFVVHTVNLIDENGTVTVSGAMTQVSSKSLGNESKYIYKQASGTLHVIFMPGANKELCGFRVINSRTGTDTEYGFENGKALPTKQSDGGYDFALAINSADTEIIIEALFVDYVEKVSSPIITPNGGTFSSSQTVEITCATEGADIYYTLDGTTPTTSSTKYTESFTISADTTVKAIAVKADMENSNVVTAKFTKKSTSSGGTGGSGGSSGGSSTPDNPSVDGKEQSWSDVAGDIEKIPEGESETISLNGNKTVPAEVIGSIAKSDAEVTFEVNNVFSWTIDGSEIDETAAKAADLSITTTTVSGTSELRGKVGTGFKINDTGVKTTLNINFKATNSGKFANLFKKVDGELVFVDNVKVDENGAAIGLEVSEKGEYVVMLGDFSDMPGDMDNDGILNAKDSLAVLKNFLQIDEGENPYVADVNGDGFINAKDALAILKKFLGIA